MSLKVSKWWMGVLPGRLALNLANYGLFCERKFCLFLEIYIFFRLFYATRLKYYTISNLPQECVQLDFYIIARKISQYFIFSWYLGVWSIQISSAHFYNFCKKCVEEKYMVFFSFPLFYFLILVSNLYCFLVLILFISFQFPLGWTKTHIYLIILLSWVLSASRLMRQPFKI